jgi:hypothetical protein
MTFCCGVSFGGAGSANCSVEAVLLGFEWAYGPVAVNRVASMAERAIVGEMGRRLGDGLGWIGESF